jgi:hypothetical protein
MNPVRRTFIHASLGTMLALLLGCAGDAGPGTGTEQTVSTGGNGGGVGYDVGTILGGTSGEGSGGVQTQRIRPANPGGPREHEGAGGPGSGDTPQPNPWTGGSSGSNQTPTPGSHHPLLGAEAPAVTR